MTLVSTWASGVAGASASSATNLASMSAAQIVNLSLKNARAIGSCTDTSKGSAAGNTFGSTTVSGAVDAQESNYFNKATGRVILLKGRLFVKESAALLALQFTTSDPKWANRWISIPASNAAYVPLSSGLTFSAMLSQVRPAGSLRKSKVGTINGVRVVAISGGANSELGLTKGVATLFVSASAPFLPVELLTGGRSQGVPTSLTVSFSHWGERVVANVPGGATPITSTDLR